MPLPTGGVNPSQENAKVEDAVDTGQPLVDGDADIKDAVPDPEAEGADQSLPQATGENPGGVAQSDQDTQGDKTADIDQSQGAKDYPEPQSAKGAFTREDGSDMNTDADHTQTAQGNKYGRSEKAVQNFRDEADRNIERLERELERAKQQRDDLDKELSDIQANGQDGGADDDGPGSAKDMERKGDEDK